MGPSKQTTRAYLRPSSYDDQDVTTTCASERLSPGGRGRQRKMPCFQKEGSEVRTPEKIPECGNSTVPARRTLSPAEGFLSIYFLVTL